MELYLIRHGQSANNADEETGKPRVCEPPLTEAGREQARRVAERLKALDWARVSYDEAGAKRGQRLTRLYASPMLRTLETAEAIRQTTGLIPYVWTDTHEAGGVWLDSGDGRGPVGMSGLGRAEMQERFPHFVLPAEVREDGWWNRPWEDAASAYARAQRVAGALRELAETDERVGIVNHGGIGSYLVDALLGLPFTPQVRFRMNNTSICRLDVVPEGATLQFSNRTDHLPGELVT
ncbi:MAG: histidine phosphatase family protein [Candidatus Latescibacteria bacterium]|nr:histidine phosphatase family protein [Candidatus Latescibacterota bacterium]